MYNLHLSKVINGGRLTSLVTSDHFRGTHPQPNLFFLSSRKALSRHYLNPWKTHSSVPAPHGPVLFFENNPKQGLGEMNCTLQSVWIDSALGICIFSIAPRGPLISH